MTYDLGNMTYGVELEFGNVWRNSPLPQGAGWSDKDNTCVSSTGIANDPKGVLYEFGGEINTKPTRTINEQLEHIQDILNTLEGPKPIVNYRSNLHIHIRVPGLKDDLQACKKLLGYIHTNQQEAFDIVEKIPVADKNLPKEVYKWAKKRETRRYRSHQYQLPMDRINEMMNAKTVQEFYEGHAPLTNKGTRMWYFSPRAGINLRQMWEETNTIEFRHFPGTLDIREIRSALLWCSSFLMYALEFGNSPREMYQDFLEDEEDIKFPEFAEYEYETEQCYQFTNFDTNSRNIVADRLKKLRERIDIDDLSTKSTDVYRVIASL